VVNPPSQADLDRSRRELERSIQERKTQQADYVRRQPTG
jgi:hypothetical protein